MRLGQTTANPSGLSPLHPEGGLDVKTNARRQRSARVLAAVAATVVTAFTMLILATDRPLEAAAVGVVVVLLPLLFLALRRPLGRRRGRFAEFGSMRPSRISGHGRGSSGRLMEAIERDSAGES